MPFNWLIKASSFIGQDIEDELSIEGIDLVVGGKMVEMEAKVHCQRS